LHLAKKTSGITLQLLAKFRMLAEGGTQLNPQERRRSYSNPICLDRLQDGVGSQRTAAESLAGCHEGRDHYLLTKTDLSGNIADLPPQLRRKFDQLNKDVQVRVCLCIAARSRAIDHQTLHGRYGP